MDISVKHDVKKLKREVTGIFRDQIPYATSVAINAVLENSREELRSALPKHLDRPTPFTVGQANSKRGSFWLHYANKRNLRGAIFLAPRQSEYLHFQIAGGTRTPFGRAIKMPVNIRVNAYGNIPRTGIRTASKRKGVFSGTVKGHQGMWQRVGGKRNPGLKMLVGWEQKAQYRKRFPYYKITHRTIDRTINDELDKALTRAIQSRRK